MSTDTDRVINFCHSFHEFWSLPFQIAVSLYLLYQQVGFVSQMVKQTAALKRFALHKGKQFKRKMNIYAKLLKTMHKLKEFIFFL